MKLRWVKHQLRRRALRRRCSILQRSARLRPAIRGLEEAERLVLSEPPSPKC